MDTDDDLDFMAMDPDNVDEVMLSRFTPAQRAKVEATARKFAWIGGNIQKGNSTPDRLRGVMLSYFDSWAARYGEPTGPLMARAAELRSIQLLREGRTGTPVSVLLLWIVVLAGLASLVAWIF